MSDNSCGCSTPLTTSTDATRVPSKKMRSLDGCNDKGQYLGIVGTDYVTGVPVKFNATANTVEPAIDGVDAIGIAWGDTVPTAAMPNVSVSRTGHIYWSEMADAVGEAVTDQAAWWAIHVEMQKVNIYVEFK